VLRRFQAVMEALERRYVRLVAWSLKHRGWTLAVALGAFAAAFPVARLVGSEFVPPADNNEIAVQLYTPVGSSLELTQEKVRQVEAAIREQPGVITTYATINTGISQGKNYASVVASLAERTKRPRSVDQMRAPLRERLGRIAGITVTNVGPPAAVGETKPISVSVQGPDLKTLEEVADRARTVIERVPGVVDLDTSSKPSKPTVSVEINRALASDLGLGVAQVSAALRPLLAGESASTWRAPDDENYDVKVRLPPGERRSVADLGRLALVSQQLEPDGSPKMVPLRQIADFEQTTGPTQINRKDLTREILITANVDGASGTAGQEIQRRLAGLATPPGYRYVTGGATKDMIESFGYALQALVLGVAFIYMILASQFGSFAQPLAIMASLPLALIGVVFALIAWRSTINMFSVIGFVMLMGLVTKNAILLVDFANRARARGVERTQALLQAAETRLRPILMTTLAMVFGMLPLAMSVTEGSEQRAPMAHAVIGGVLASTLLTLVVVPVFYTFIDDASRWARNRLVKS
jgi:HAE1 family hydrophobic/amphiphilic exporter-1